MASTTYTKAIIITHATVEDAQKNWGLTHPLWDEFFVDLQQKGLMPLALLDEYPNTEIVAENAFKDHFTSAEIRDQYLATCKAVADDLGTSFTYELLDVEPFEFP